MVFTIRRPQRKSRSRRKRRIPRVTGGGAFALAIQPIPFQDSRRMAAKKSTTEKQSSDMDLKEIKEIVDLMSKNEISFFQLERGGSSLQLRRGHDMDALKDLLAALPAGFGGGSTSHGSVIHSAPAAPSLPAPVAAPAAAPQAPKEEPVGPAVTSPMVGTFYRSSAPGEKPFLSVGDHVEVGRVVCIIEAMKVMNEIKAETSGTVVRVIAEDGKPVQYGQPLFQLK